MNFQVTILAPENSIAQIFLPYEDHYSEKVANNRSVKGNKWKTISFNFSSRKINEFRFDPGTIGGEYRIKDFSISYPLTNTRHQLDLEGFIPLKDIETLTFDGEYLKITAGKSATDPSMIYTKELPDNWITKEMVLLFVFMAIVSIMSLIFFILGKFHIANQKF